MINGTHVLLFSSSPEADRAFFKDVLELSFVDAGHGWLIFGLPPAEIAVHPTEGEPIRQPEGALLGASLYLMCDDVEATVKMLESKGVPCTPRHVERWGIRTTLRLPSGGELGLYQPTHPTAIKA
jgi:catechol 2,3-dioxygenase-like lactoylglutathione lyase family enzyme